MNETQINSNKRLFQKQITSYFSNGKIIPKNEQLIKQNKAKKGMKRTTNDRIINQEEMTNFIKPNQSLRPTKPDFTRVEKRKLVVEIFSEDEDKEIRKTRISNDENDTSQSSPSKKPKSASETIHECINKHSYSLSTINETIVNNNTSQISESSYNSSLLISQNNSHSLGQSDNNRNIKSDLPSTINFSNLILFKQLTMKILEASHLKSLLCANVKGFLLKFFEMTDKYQLICLKLFLWKRKWYNIFRFIKTLKICLDDNEILELYNLLKDNQFVDTNYMKYDLKPLLIAMQKNEIIEICRSFRIKGNDNKEVLIEKLLKYCTQQGTISPSKTTIEILRERIREKMGCCIKFKQETYDSLYKFYILGTFTNPHYNDIAEFFRNDPNIIYPKYNIDNYCMFRNDEEFSKFFNAKMCKIEFEKLLEMKMNAKMLDLTNKAFEELQKLNDSGLEISLPRYLERFTAAAQYVSLLSKACKHLVTTSFENVQLWLEYLISQHYHKQKIGFWYCQLALIQMKYLNDYQTAAKTVIKAFQNEKDCLSDVQLYELSYRANLLKKSKKYKISQLYHDKLVSLMPNDYDEELPSITLDVQGVKSNDPGKKRLYLDYQNDGSRIYMTVEEVAIQHYQKNGYPYGIHCEGSLICAIFTVLFWDLIYDYYVKGTFISDIQSVPLDMYSKYFYINRKNVIEQRLNEIKSDWSEVKLMEFVKNIYNEHSHKTALIQINKIITNPKYLINIIVCIGRNVVCKIFERLLENFGQYSSGFPDLFVWDVKRKICKFVEVKSDNDKLSVKQTVWLNYLLKIGCDAEVCHVHSIGTKKKSKLTANKSRKLEEN